jgi:hypothetical protein
MKKKLSCGCTVLTLGTVLIVCILIVLFYNPRSLAPFLPYELNNQLFPMPTYIGQVNSTLTPMSEEMVHEYETQAAIGDQVAFDMMYNSGADVNTGDSNCWFVGQGEDVEWEKSIIQDYVLIFSEFVKNENDIRFAKAVTNGVTITFPETVKLLTELRQNSGDSAFTCLVQITELSIIYNSESDFRLMNIDKYIHFYYNVPENVSMLDITEFQTLRQDAQELKISSSKFQNSSETMVQKIGKNGFAWLVRNMFFFDPATNKWSRTEDFLKTSPGYDSIPPDCRLSQDPVGTGVDLLFGSYSYEDMSNWICADR